MPYNSIDELPDSVTNVLPKHAQDIYKEAFNHAWDEYEDDEERRDDSSREVAVHKVAWSTVKHLYHKADDGRWHRNA